jgi:SAM-dependent methyltransferase
VPALTRSIAQKWISRWDRQQEGSVPDREDRFATLIDAVEAGVGRPDPLVLDLGCGPGSLAARLLDRLPAATVIAVDTDPLLLSLGRAGYGDRPGVRFLDLDLGTPGWHAALGLDRQADAAVSTTALHWLSEPQLRAAYTALATVLRSGGIFLNGDHLAVEDSTPTLATLEHALLERTLGRRFADGQPEDWRQWWDAVATDPGLGQFQARHSDTADHHGSKSQHLSTHVTALREAGFGEIGTLWQRGDNRVLCAIRS